MAETLPTPNLNKRDQGLCYWAGCSFKATEVLMVGMIEHKGVAANIGNIELCHGHTQRAERLGRLNLDWDLVEHLSGGTLHQ